MLSPIQQKERIASQSLHFSPVKDNALNSMFEGGWLGGWLHYGHILPVHKSTVSKQACEQQHFTNP